MKDNRHEPNIDKKEETLCGLSGKLSFLDSCFLSVVSGSLLSGKLSLVCAPHSLISLFACFLSWGASCLSLAVTFLLFYFRKFSCFSCRIMNHFLFKFFISFIIWFVIWGDLFFGFFFNVSFLSFQLMDVLSSITLLFSRVFHSSLSFIHFSLSFILFSFGRCFYLFSFTKPILCLSGFLLIFLLLCCVPFNALL